MASSVSALEVLFPNARSFKDYLFALGIDIIRPEDTDDFLDFVSTTMIHPLKSALPADTIDCSNSVRMGMSDVNHIYYVIDRG
jgi:hypothetical protein